MGSAPTEPERRPGEDQVVLVVTRAFWMAKYEATQAEWKRVMGKLPGEPATELLAGDDLPVGNVNFAEAEGFLSKAQRSQPAIRRSAGRLGISTADRSAMGVRLSCRHDVGHGVPPPLALILYTRVELYRE